VTPEGAGRRRALITQNHMIELAGSEILTLEPAEALSRREYAVTVFSHVVGDPIARVARERGISLTDDPNTLDGLQVELAWIHHQVIPDTLMSAINGPRGLVVFGHMSPIEPLELPFLPDIEGRIADVVVANSDETAAALRAFDVGDPPLVVLGNPAPDSFWDALRSHPKTLRRLLLVSNHLPAELCLAAGRLRAQGLEVVHIGWPDSIVPVGPEEVAAADAVVTVGKTVQYALAVGRPVFCYDAHGGPGWLSSGNLSQARWHNFSGRPFGAMSADEIVRAIFDGYEQANSEIDVLRDAVSDLTWSRGLDLVLEAAAGSSRVKHELSESDKRCVSACFVLAARSARAHQALVKSDASGRSLSAALRANGVSLSAAQTATDLLAKRNADLQEQLDALLESKSLRLTAPLRRSADSLRRIREPGRIRVGYRRHRAPTPEVFRVDSLPALAWLCRVSAGTRQLFVGPEVDATADGISEGAWVGPFRHDCLRASQAAFGSGVTFGEDGLVFVPPSHPREALYILEEVESGTSFVSNSLSFATAQIPDCEFGRFAELLSGSLRETVDRATAMGVDVAPTELLFARGYRLSRRAFFKFRIAGAGLPITLADAEVQPFRDFQAYRDFLSRSLAELFRNAGDPARAHRLRPVVALSRGYDSTAVAVLAAENGCKEAVTLDVVVTGTNDSGEAIAKKLGLNVTARSHVMGSRVDNLRVDFGTRLAAQATEFLATEGVGDDVAFLPFEPDLHHGLLLTGVWGDMVWARDADVGAGLPVRTPFGKSITEFRLRAGFAHVPVPFMAGRAADSIAAISRAKEMLPYSVGGTYDRPIPRRIGEEGGLARSDFGSEKAATAPLPTNRAALFTDALATVRQRYIAVG
jgi:hypothetical protein